MIARGKKACLNFILLLRLALKVDAEPITQEMADMGKKVVTVLPNAQVFKGG